MTRRTRCTGLRGCSGSGCGRSLCAASDPRVGRLPIGAAGRSSPQPTPSTGSAEGSSAPAPLRTPLFGCAPARRACAAPQRPLTGGSTATSPASRLCALEHLGPVDLPFYDARVPGSRTGDRHVPLKTEGPSSGRQPRSAAGGCRGDEAPATLVAERGAAAEASTPGQAWSSRHDPVSQMGSTTGSFAGRPTAHGSIASSDCGAAMCPTIWCSGIEVVVLLGAVTPATRSAPDPSRQPSTPEHR